MSMVVSQIHRAARNLLLRRRFASSSAAPERPRTAIVKKKGKDSRFATVGLPLLLFIVGGYFTLTQFVGGKYEARDHKIKSQSTRAFDLTEEHQKMAKKLLTEDFELKPVPRLDEEPPRKSK